VLGGLVRVPFRFQGRVTPKEGLNLLRHYLRYPWRDFPV
jgi:hypothetical protein